MALAPSKNPVKPGLQPSVGRLEKFILRTSAEVTAQVQAKHMQNQHGVMHCCGRGSGSLDRVDGNQVMRRLAAQAVA
jgi:hypothetical protein